MHCVVAAHCSFGSSFSVFRCFCCCCLGPPAATRRGRFLAALVAVALPPALSIIKNDVMDIDMCFCLKHTRTHSSASKSRQAFACEHVSALPFTTRRPCAPCTKPFRNQKLWKRRHVDGRCKSHRVQRIYLVENRNCQEGTLACLNNTAQDRLHWNSRHSYCSCSNDDGENNNRKQQHQLRLWLWRSLHTPQATTRTAVPSIKQPQGQWCSASSNNATQ
jgi:hypothetical protein